MSQNTCAECGEFHNLNECPKCGSQSYGTDEDFSEKSENIPESDQDEEC